MRKDKKRAGGVDSTDIGRLEATFVGIRQMEQTVRQKIIDYYISQEANPKECDHPLTKPNLARVQKYRICECCGYDKVEISDPKYRRLER